MDAEARVATMLGNPKRAIIAMAIPIILSLLVAEVNMLADRAWCSGLGVEALASIAVVRPIYNVYSGLGAGLGVGAAAVISRYIGAERPSDASSGAIQAIILAVIFGIILTPIMFLLQPGLIELIGSEDIQDSTVAYLTNFTVCLVLIMVNGTIGGILNGQGAANLSTAMMMVLAVSNIILDPIFIYILDFGLVGASAATMVATSLSMLVGIGYIMSRRTYLRFDRSVLRFESEQMRVITKAGFPQMLEYLVVFGMDAILNMIIISCAGSEGLTIFSTPDALVALMIVPAMAIGSALVTVASDAYGQRDLERMRKAYLFAVELTLTISITLLVIVELIPGVFMSPFTYSDEMAELKPQIIDTMRIIAIYAPLFSMNPVCSGLLQAMKHPERSVIMAIIRNLIMIGLYMFGAAYSLTAICWALDIGHVIGAAMSLIVAFVTYRAVSRTWDSITSQTV
ncbi:MAG: hypothetical protein J6Y18_04895 [Candidatus Methanomethylophilaceae archaeon]|nr:hypothetical protein [Candidatus Methanomethylophilaceae archaeon]